MSGRGILYYEQEQHINWSHFNITLRLAKLVVLEKTLRQMLIAEWRQLLQNIPKHQIFKSYILGPQVHPFVDD